MAAESSPLERIKATERETEFMGGVDDRVGVLRSDLALLIAAVDVCSVVQGIAEDRHPAGCWPPMESTACICGIRQASAALRALTATAGKDAGERRG